MRADSWTVIQRIVLDQHEFESLRITSGEIVSVPAPPETLCRALINGRWHAVDRQYQFGMPVHFARPIVVRLKAA